MGAPPATQNRRSHSMSIPPDLVKAYRERRAQLDKACTALENHLKAALKPLASRVYFRPRLVESRVKSIESLSAKVRGLSPAQVFDGESIKDLIGGRIVCHNLQDIPEVLGRLGEYAHLKVNMREPPNLQGAHEGDPETGYRAVHAIVSWKSAGRSWNAEVQIRTLLQDAWASFMHDDIYEHGAKEDIPEAVRNILKTTSLLLYSLDLMADQLREWAVKRTESGLSLIDRIELGLAGLATWFDSAIDARGYERIERTDRYTITGIDGTYNIAIDARLPKKEKRPFVIHLTGDTEVVSLNLCRS